MNWFSPYSRFERRLLKNVDQHGCHINYVFADGDSPDFGYSVGFQTTVGQPEVIITGMKQDMVCFCINRVLDFCKDGLVLADGTKIGGVLEDGDLIARPVHPSRFTIDWLNSALWYHEQILGRSLSAVFQLFWPSAQDDCFPWENGCSDEFRQLQPSLTEAQP